MDRERHIWVRFDAARVRLLVAFYRHLIDVPLLVLRLVVDGVHFGRVVSQVNFEAVERPRDEDDLALLSVEREVTYIERAVCLRDGRKHPEHVTVVRDYREGVHEVLEAVVGTGTRRGWC